MTSRLGRIRRLFADHPLALGMGQVVALAALLVLAGWAVHGELGEAATRLRDASVGEFLLGCAAIAVYYLLFVFGWIWILGAWGIQIGYPAALRAEMVSMLAKYIPGGIWTPAARVVAARRAGIDDAGLVTASILVEAGLSAVSGVLVFVVSLAWVDGVDQPIWPLVGFGLVLAIVLHPRIFQALAGRILRRFGTELPKLPTRTLLGLLGYYACTWLVGGVAMLFLVRSVGGHPGAETIAFLGGTSAVGAIFAVLAFFTPSGLGAREGAMYGLLLAVTTRDIALGATVLNRAAITLVEVALLVAGVFVFRLRDETRAFETEMEGERV